MGIKQKDVLIKIKDIIESNSILLSDLERVDAIDSIIKIYEERYGKLN